MSHNDARCPGSPTCSHKYVVAPRPTFRTVRVVLPVEIKVHPGGHVEYAVDTSKASTAVAEKGAESADLALIEADHERRQALEAAVPTGFEVVGSDRGRFWFLRHKACGTLGRPHVIPIGSWAADDAAAHRCPEAAK